MKKITAKFFINIIALMIFSGCNNLFDNNIKQNDDSDKLSKTVTLKGSLALEGNAAPSEFLAMTKSTSSRSAVSGGLMNGEYSFSLTATVPNTREPVSADIDGNQFSITLEAEKNYGFDLKLGPASPSASVGFSSLTISKIMFGDKVADPNSINIKKYTPKDVENTKVYFSPNTSISGAGKIALEIKNDVENVKYAGYTIGFDDGTTNFEGTGSVEFYDGKADIVLTEFTTKKGEEVKINNGIYDLTLEFYDKDPDESATARPTPLAVTYQKVNVFAGFITDTWISDGSVYFDADVGEKGEFKVTQEAIEAYKNPKEFYVKGDGSDGSWGNAGDWNSGTSIRRSFKTLQQAIDTVIAANDTKSEYTIYVKDTVYPNVKLNNSGEIESCKMADFSELGTTALKLTIVGVGGNATLSGLKSSSGGTYGSIVLIGNYDEKTPANNIVIPNLNLALENLAIRDGNAELNGGGIFNNGATVTLKNCTVTNNEAGKGGGIFSIGATVTLENCNIENNVAYNGSGVYCLDGEIIIDETAITSNTYIDLFNGRVCYDQGIKLENSTLTIKNTLTLGNSILVIGGESTIVNVDGNDAVIKRDESVNASDFAFVCVDNATLNLKGKIIFEDYNEGVLLNETSSFLKLDGKITGSGEKPLDVHVKNEIGRITGTSETYVPIIIEDTYSNDSKIFVKLEGINNISSDVLVSNCNENRTKTFDVVCEPSGGGSERFIVTPKGKLKTTIFTQAEFIAYCSELYESGDYADKMTLNISSGSPVGNVTLSNIEGMQAGLLVNNIEINDVKEVYKYVTKLVIPEGYKTITSSYGAQGLFYGNSQLCENLEEITLPSSIVSIGEYTFNNCTKLKKITINGDVESIGKYAFAKCSTLTEIELPTGLKSIGGHAFYRTGLTSIEIPDGVEELPEFAFDGSYLLERIKLPKNLKKLGQNALGGRYLDSTENVNKVNTVLTSIELPEGLEEIGESAFSYQQALTSITIPSSVTEIKNYVFTECTALETVVMLKETPPTLGQYNVFPSSVKAILVPSEAAKTAYTNATNWSDYKDKICVRFTKEKLEADLASKNLSASTVEYYEMPSGYGVIMPNTFSDCENLKGVVIPADVIKIEADAFKDCAKLVSVTLTRYNENSSSIITSIVSTKDDSSKPNSFNGCTKLAAVYVPDMSNDPAGTLNTTYSYGWASTNYQGKLKSSTLSPISFKEFSENLDKNTTTSIEIPFGYTVINTYDDDDANSVFSAYPKLETITLPESVVEISSSAFKECTVSSLTIKAQTPPTLGDTNPLTPTRRNIPVTIAILVPESAVETYKNECENSGTWNGKANANQIYAIGEIPATSIETKTTTIRIGVGESFDLMKIITIEPSNYTKNKLNITVKDGNNGEYPNAVEGTKVQNLEDRAKGTITVTLGHLKPIDISFICYASEVFDADALNSIQGDTSIGTLTIPYGFTSIEGSDTNPVFASYSSLQSITIPETVTSMNAYMGFGSNITTITMNCPPPSIEGGTFNGLTSSNGNTNLFVPKAYKTEYNQWYSENNLSDKFKLNFE